jgi:hypothetical protein
MIRHIALTILAGLVVVSSVQAGQQKPSADTWGGGVLVSVDAPGKAIVVRQGEHEQRYELREDVDVRGRAAAGLDELDKGIGHQVTIRYELDGESRVANRVNVLDRKGTATAANSRAGGGGKTTEP